MGDEKKEHPEHPEHPHGAPPGQSGEHPQDKPDKPEEPEAEPKGAASDDGKPWGYRLDDGRWIELPKPPLLLGGYGPPPFTVELPSGQLREVVHRP